MPSSDNDIKNPKFTRGEKCLFVHLIVTFAIIMVMTITYFVHLCMVGHTKEEVLKIYRRIFDKSITALSQSDYQSIGVMYLNDTEPTVVCNTLLLGERWSLAPAQCTSMREDPDMSNYLHQWKIKYRIDGKHILTNIKRSYTHSHFNRDDYRNNIGLFEHEDPIHKKEYYVAPPNMIIDDEILEKYERQMVLVDWELEFTKKGDISEAVINRVRPIYSEKCSIYSNPIIERLRNYEFCATFETSGPIADHGAMFVMDSKIVGYFSWGDIQGRGVPLIILNILHFREWFENIAYL